MNVKVLIVDDEPLARRGVSIRLQERKPEWEIVGEYETGEEAFEAMSISRPDLVFLDIQLPGTSGIEMLRSISGDDMPYVIFLTGHEEYALAAFEVGACDYLLKPIDERRFVSALSRAARTIELRHPVKRRSRRHASLSNAGEEGGQFVARFAVRARNRIVFVPIEDVEWIEALGDYAGLHCNAKTHLVRESLNSLETKLDQTRFVRIHRSAIVQVNTIDQIELLPNRDCKVVLKSGVSLRASRTYSHVLRMWSQHRCIR